jgi:hypothetical protein
VRPDLWPTAIVELWRLAAPGWWHRWPPVPRPDPEYLRFRLQTAYGDGAAGPSAGDLVEYLAWCRRMNALVPRRHRAAAGKSLTGLRHRASVTIVSPEPPNTASNRNRRFRKR